MKMRKDIPKPVYEISLSINQFLYEKDKGESLSALVISLAMNLKRSCMRYEDYLEKRKEIVTRLMDLTNLDEDEFKEELKIFAQIMKEAA